MTDAPSTGYQRPCPHGDPTCPCQDGDMCHYEGPDPMTPTSEPWGTEVMFTMGCCGSVPDEFGAFHSIDAAEHAARSLRRGDHKVTVYRRVTTYEPFCEDVECSCRCLRPLEETP